MKVAASHAVGPKEGEVTVLGGGTGKRKGPQRVGQRPGAARGWPGRGEPNGGSIEGDCTRPGAERGRLGG